MFVCCFFSVILTFRFTDGWSTESSKHVLGILPAKATSNSIRLKLSTTENGVVNYTIRSLISGVLLTGQISKVSPQSQTISLSNIVSSDTDRYKGIEVTTGSSKKLSVVVSAGDPNEAGYAYQALPPWGYNTDEYVYYGAGLEDIETKPLGNKATALIVAANNGTEISLTPKNAAITVPADLAPSGVPTTVVPGSTITFTMDYLWTFLIKNDQLSGLKVVSNKPIAFLAGHECAALPAGEFFCDPLADQLPPTVAWGNEFFLTSFEGKPNSGMQLEVVSSAPNNTVRMYCNNDNSEPFVHFLENPGDFEYQQVENNPLCYVIADHPIILLEFSYSYLTQNEFSGDPLMVSIPPIHHYLQSSSHIPFVELGTSDPVYMNLIITLDSGEFENSQILINGNSVQYSLKHTPASTNSSVSGGYIARGIELPSAGSNILAPSQYRFTAIVYSFGIQGYGFGYSGSRSVLPFNLKGMQ